MRIIKRFRELFFFYYDHLFLLLLPFPFLVLFLSLSSPFPPDTGRVPASREPFLQSLICSSVAFIQSRACITEINPNDFPLPSASWLTAPGLKSSQRRSPPPQHIHHSSILGLSSTTCYHFLSHGFLAVGLMCSVITRRKDTHSRMPLK